MKKLRLALDTLAVATFETATGAGAALVVGTTAVPTFYAGFLASPALPAKES